MSGTHRATAAINNSIRVINEELQDVIAVLIKNPNILEGNPWNHQLYQLAVAHVEAKARMSTTATDLFFNSGEEVLEAMVNDFFNADEDTKLLYSRRVAAKVFEMSSDDLRVIPGKLKEEMFAITLIWLAKTMG